MRAMANDDDLIGTTTAGELLDISPSMVVRWTNAGLLPLRGRIRTGTAGGKGTMVFERGAIEAIAEQRRRNAAALPDDRVEIVEIAE